MTDAPTVTRALRHAATVTERPGVAVAYQALEDALRREIAERILRQRQPCPDHPEAGRPSCSACGENHAYSRAARMALGIHRELPAGASS
ncbi:hypothetical protein [Nonomuraea basaltis]|uniref:hypothetical protein n=1 Tax=Nonomuraea basaltis TaxID=2495887 RepID=UPI00110C5312|nr:hypothetical protein [Nonomuraea basaltis]TMR92551.1 hypothetical protein EJK15_43905 [Nonomuraea basaltis]